MTTRPGSGKDHAADPTAVAAAGVVEGGLLAITPDGVIGWGRDVVAPEKPLNVVLLVNDNLAGVGLCNRFDLDVVRSRIGPGIPGFLIGLDRQAPTAGPLRLTLRDTKGRVLGEPLVLAADMAGAHTVEQDGIAYEGMVDGLRDGVLLGWARSVAHADRRIIVELHDGDERIARQSAQQHRDDLVVAGKGDGACAFAFELPMSLLDGREHCLRVTVAGTSFELPNSPILFGRHAASSILEEIVRLRQTVQTLQLQVEKVVAPDGALQSELVRALCERVAAFTDIQRDMVEREMDVLRRRGFVGATPAAAGGSRRKTTDGRPGKTVSA